MQFLFEKNHFTLDSHLNHRDLNAQSTDSFEAIIFMAFKCLSISYILAIISYIQYILLFFSFVSSSSRRALMGPRTMQGHLRVETRG